MGVGLPDVPLVLVEGWNNVKISESIVMRLMNLIVNKKKACAKKKIDSALTDKIKKSSINTAPNGRIPAIRLLKQIMSKTLDEGKQTNK